MHFKIIIAAVTLTLGAPLVTDAARPPGYQCVFEKPYSYCWKPAHANTKRGRWVWRTDYYLWVPARKFAATLLKLGSGQERNSTTAGWSRSAWSASASSLQIWSST